MVQMSTPYSIFVKQEQSQTETYHKIKTLIHLITQKLYIAKLLFLLSIFEAISNPKLIQRHTGNHITLFLKIMFIRWCFWLTNEFVTLPSQVGQNHHILCTTGSPY